MMTKTKIIYKNETGYVHQQGLGHYEIYKNGICAAHRVGTVHFPDDPENALKRAIQRCDDIK